MTTIAQNCTERVTVGVDTHKDTHAAVALDPVGRVVGNIEIQTGLKGYRRLLDWSKALAEDLQFGIEGTGSFGAGLSRFLAEQGQKVVEVDRPNRKARRAKGKSDPLDAEQAARQVMAGTAAAVPKAKDGQVEMMRALQVARQSALKAAVQATNNLHSLVISAPDALRERLRGLTATRLVATCAGFRPGNCDNLQTAVKIALRALANRIQGLEDEVKALDVQLDQLVKLTGAELLELCGVGTQVATTLLISAGDNPQRLRTEACAAKLWGVGPIPASSGQTQRHRLNRGGDRQANAALFRIVIVRMRFHEPTKRYVERRTKEGKSKKEIIRCLKRYVAREIYSVLQRIAVRRMAIPA
jgi:transposase